MTTVDSWLASIELSEYAAAFGQHHIDLPALGALTEADLKELGMPIGHRKRFLNAVGALQGDRSDANSRQPLVEVLQRRQLTVMFCDVVNSSALPERLEGEDVIEVIQAYRKLCSEAIAKYDGLTARFVGDGILAYFGHPVAHEEDAERSIRAALEITRTIGALELPRRITLEVRVGIATGLVIVGDLATLGGVDKQSVVGSTPNLAARLQALAPPNGIVISQGTLALVSGFFYCEDYGARVLQGFAEPARCWLVREERPLVSRFVARRALGQMARMVNREKEVQQLRASWRQALDGRGGTVMIHGEAGIGKSRLLEHFLMEVGASDIVLQHFPTSPFDMNSPLYGVKLRLREAARISEEDNAAVRLTKLDSVIIGDEFARKRVLPVFASLFSLGERDADLSPAQLKQATFEALLDQFRRLAQAKPLVIAIEDLHWLDPTTFEFLELVRDEAERSRALIVLTSRDSPAPAWAARSNTRVVEMARLTFDDSIKLVQRVLGATSSSDLELKIAERSDGIPLFAEELARSILASGNGAPAAGATVIPASLHQSLAARFDQAGAARELAQAGAVVGRSMSHGLLSEVSGLEPAILQIHLDALLRSGIIYPDPAAEEPRYVFKHALLRDAAYSSMVRDRRQLLHSRAAAALARRSPQIVDEQPELLAYHMSEAGALDEAVSYWLLAARRSLSRSSLVEATAHLRRGIGALKGLPSTPINKERQLQFMALLGPALIALSGPGSSEAEDLYAEAFNLCVDLPESPNHFAIYWGWWRVARDFVERERRADALLRGAKARGDDEPLLQAHHCQWANQFFLGNLGACCGHIDDGLSIYARGDYRTHATLYGNHDAKVCAHGERSLVYCMQCRPESALIEERKALAWAAELSHQGSVSHAMDIALMHRYFRGGAQAVLAHAEALIRFGREKGYADFAGKGQIFQGWARALTGDAVQGVAMLEDGLERQKDVSTIEDFPFYFSMVAEARSLAGRHEEALTKLCEDEAFLQRIGLEMWMPEIRRWKGVLLRTVAPREHAAALGAFEGALVQAKAQGALALELRAAIDLSRLRCDLGADADAAAKIIEAALARVTEGFDTPVVVQAQRLVTALRGPATASAARHLAKDPI
jgi:class 3 adenylate cyclase/predicted ATPase